MLTHVCVGTNDLPRAKIFYDATFAVIGVRPGYEDTPNHRVIYRHDGLLFLVGLPIDGEPATHGGTAIEDPPGVRQLANLYLAYLRDPDGNKLCASYLMPKA